MDCETLNLQERYTKIIKNTMYLHYTKTNCREEYNLDSVQSISKFSMFSYPGLDAERLRSRFNTFFRDDLYGKYRDDENLILSSGSLNSEEFPLCNALKYAIDFAVMKNWYGYSDCLGHINSRNAIADLMNIRMPAYEVKTDNIALTNGVTSGLNTVLRTLKTIIGHDFHILTHFPTYSPFYTSCASIAQVDTIMLDGGRINAEQVLNMIKKDTKVLLLIGDLNPMGQMVSMATLNTLICECTKKGIWIIFDEAGAVYPEYNYQDLVYSPYFILLNSDSKRLGIPGLKTGYLVASELIVNSFYLEASVTYGSPASVFYLLQEFYARFQQFELMGISKLDQSHLALFREDYELTLPFLELLYQDYLYTYQNYEAKVVKKRKWVIHQLKKLPKHLVSQVVVPQTGVNISIHIAQWNDSYNFFISLLSEKKVSVFPGKCSGIDSGCWIRISYALSDEQLHLGINKIVDFLNEHDVFSKCERNPLYHHYLIEIGGYSRYQWLNFWGHIDDVYRCMRRIYSFTGKSLNISTKKLFEELSYLHDCGKVISVRLASVHRILKNQYQENADWNKFNDIELLGLKDRLLRGEVFSKGELLEMIPEERHYFDLIDFNKNYSPSDDIVRERILEANYNDIFAIELLKKPIPKLTEDSTIEENALALLDISDKCSDYLPIDEISADALLEALKKKEQYVHEKYECNQAAERITVHNDFQLARHNLKFLLDSIGETE